MKSITKAIIYIFFIFSMCFYFISCDDSGIVTTTPKNNQFVKNYGGANADLMTSMQLTSDGGSIVTGYTISFSFGDNDIFVSRLDGSGNISWSSVYGGSGNDQAECIIQTSDGGYLVAGQTKSFG